MDLPDEESNNMPGTSRLSECMVPDEHRCPPRRNIEGRLVGRSTGSFEATGKAFQITARMVAGVEPYRRACSSRGGHAQPAPRWQAALASARAELRRWAIGQGMLAGHWARSGLMLQGDSRGDLARPPGLMWRDLCNGPLWVAAVSGNSASSSLPLLQRKLSAQYEWEADRVESGVGQRGRRGYRARHDASLRTRCLRIVVCAVLHNNDLSDGGRHG